MFELISVPYLNVKCCHNCGLRNFFFKALASSHRRLNSTVIVCWLFDRARTKSAYHVTCDIPNPWEIRTTALRLHTDRYWSYKCQCCRETLGVRLDSSSSRIGPEGSSPQRFNSMQDMPIYPHHGFTLPAELIHNIISWVLVNSIHSICVSTEDVKWEKDIMNILCNVSPSFRAIAIEIVAKAFEISRGTDTDEEEERWTPALYYLIQCLNGSHRILATIQQIFIHLRQLGVRVRDRTEWESVSFQVVDISKSPFTSAYALYISCVSLRRYASRSHREDFETANQVVLSALAQSENLCNRVWPINMTDLIRKKIQDELQYAHAGQSFLSNAVSLLINFY